MDELLQRVTLAKTDSHSMDALLADYLPFVRAEAGKFGASGLEYDDKLSLCLLVFVNCVKQYEASRGGFLGFAAFCMRNRMIDAARGAGRQPKTIPLDGEEESALTAQRQASLFQYQREAEQRSLQEEIAQLEEQLAPFGLHLTELAKICPKQKRSRESCRQLAGILVTNPTLAATFWETRRLPQAQLARLGGVSEKTVEKYRRYLVALAVILTGDYPGIGAYIPGYHHLQKGGQAE